MPPLPTVAVVILNWNTRSFLEKFLPSVLQFSEDHASVVVVDNASTDDSVHFLQSTFPEVNVIRNSRNDGFAGGYNAGLASVKADYFLLLNSDVLVTENWLPPLMNLMEANPDIAACQPKILSFHNPQAFEYAGAGGGYIDKYGYPFCRGRIFNSIEIDHHQYDDACDVFWASGACMMVRASVFHTLGGFDENFFAHMEEIDLCWRMRSAGFRVAATGKSHVFHVGGGTLHKSNPHKTFLNFRNNLLMLFKNYPPSQKARIFKVRWILDHLAAVKFLISGSLADYKAVRKAYTEFRKLKTRYPASGLPPQDKVAVKSLLMYPNSILIDYYLYRRRKFSALNWFSKEKPAKRL